MSRLAACAGLLCAPLVAHAQSAAAPPICTDRPTKSNATCTVPAGEWQLETDIANATHDRQGTAVTNTVYPLNPYLKYGLGASTDIEVNWAPVVRIHTKDDGGRHSTTGSGDLVIRFKSRLYASDQVSIAIIPFVKAPTAHSGIGNDHWEGGMIMPVGVGLPGGFSLTLGPEVDVLADADGRGHHVSLTNLVNVSRPLTSRLTFAVELWQQNNRDPAGTIKQQSADAALAFAVTPTFQVDVGANLGLNAQTPGHQIYLGMAYRW